MAPASQENSNNAPVFNRCSSITCSAVSALFCGLHVDHLPADHAVAARGLRQMSDELAPHFGGRMGRRIGEDFERDGEEPIARKDGGGFIEGAVGGGPAPAQIVIVHGRKVVMDQRIGVQHFDGGGGPHRIGLGHAEQARALENEERTEALAAREGGVAHGLLRPGVEARGPGQQGIERRLDRHGRAGQRRVQISGLILGANLHQNPSVAGGVRNHRAFVQASG